MSKKLALILGTTVLTVTLAVLGVAVWRVGDLRTVLERPRAAGNTGVIQGCKQTAGLVACDNTANNLARNAEVRMDGGSLQTSQPYSFQNLAAGSTHTVSVTPISGYATEYVYCYNSIMDYTTNPYGCKQGGQVIGVATRASGGSVSVTVPSSPDPTIGYSLVDLHWWFAPTVAKTCSVSLSSASIATGQSVNVTTTGSGGTVKTTLSRTDSGTISLGQLFFTDSSGHKYYDITGTPTLTGLTAGEYKVFCHVAEEPNKCSGNPFCAYEGASPGIQGCEGWVSCSGSDNAGLTVAVCTSDVNCPDDETCVNGQCVTPACPITPPDGINGCKQWAVQNHACQAVNKANNTACSTSSGASGTCQSGVCVVPGITANECEVCEGFAGRACASGLICKKASNAGVDQGGICVSASSKCGACNTDAACSSPLMCIID